MPLKSEFPRAWYINCSEFIPTAVTLVKPNAEFIPTNREFYAHCLNGFSV